MRVLFAMILAVPCAASADEGARARMEAFSNGLKSVTAGFDQSVTDANGHRGDGSSGTFALSAPRQFRWETRAPYEQTIVADGTRVWVYEPDLEQVSVRSQSAAEAHSPLTVLTDLPSLDRQFKASEAGQREGLSWLRLESREADADFEYAELGFDASTLQRMQFKDALGNLTQIRFSDWKRNPAIPPATFTFKPPAGVDVVGDARPDAEVYPVKE